ncbi:MAG: sodium:calcium antiporter [Chloroflexi bacterium]|nr:sodium:calcium antiporter [Chloroflexota bacterium]
MQSILLIVAGILVIFAACELFVNSIEWLGRILRISENAVGTVLAAVGTALPESLVTLIALVFSHGQAGSEDIGIGAILGGPLMLGTIAYGVVGLTAVSAGRSRRHGARLTFNQAEIAADVLWFLAIFAAAIAGSAIRFQAARIGLAIVLVGAYFVYAFRKLGQEAGEQRALNRLHFHRRVAVPDAWRVVLQVALGVLGMIYGANLFVDNLSVLARGAGIAAVVLSILLSPVATELPEIMNAVLWVRQGKEDLAVGNVSGSMLVQSAIPCALGLSFSTWELSRQPLVAAAAIFASTLFIYVNLRARRLNAPRLLAAGLPYLAVLGLFAAGV